MKVCFFFLVFCLSVTLNAKTCDSLTVSGSDQWIPFAYSERETVEKRATGIAYDVVNLIGESLNIPINILIGIPWARIEAMLEKGDLDLLAGNYWNEERARKWIITNEFATDEVRVFVNTNNIFVFDSLSDLENRNGLMPQGISFGQKFDSYKPRLKLETVQLHEQMIHMLNLNRADYIILPFYSGHNKIRKLGYQGKIVALEHPVNINNVHLSLSRNSPCASLIQDINEVIEKAKRDGRFQAIFENYL